MNGGMYACMNEWMHASKLATESLKLQESMLQLKKQTLEKRKPKLETHRKMPPPPPPPLVVKSITELLMTEYMHIYVKLDTWT